MTKQILINNIYTFIGRRGSGKTMLACIWGSFSEYVQVFANFELSYKYKKVIRFSDFDLFGKLDQDDKTKKLIIYDEGGVNTNARNFQSKNNKLVSMLTFVSRKYNIDFIFITQDFGTIDKNIRQQSDYVVEIVGGLPRHIEYNIHTVSGGTIQYLRGTYTIDALSVLDIYKIKYNTADLSGFDKKIKDFVKKV